MIEVTVTQTRYGAGCARPGTRGSATRGGIIGGLIMSFFLVAAVLVIASIAVVQKIKVHQSGNGDDVRVETPFGSVHVTHSQDGHPQSAGIPLYPGAVPMSGHDNAVVDLSSDMVDKDLHIVAGKWKSSDSIDKVRKFYETKYPEMSVIQHDGSVEMHNVNGKNKRVIALC